MKKLLAAMLAAVMLISLAACGGKEDGSTKDTEKAPSAQTSTDADNADAGEEAAFVFSVWSSDRSVLYAIGPDMDMADVLAALGEPQTYFEAESCAFEGLDKTYTYAGFVIETRPDGEKDYVNAVLLTDDSVATDEGIYIGSSRADVLAAYGETDGSVPSLLSYTQGGCTLNFILDGDNVISIEYLPA